MATTGTTLKGLRSFILSASVSWCGCSDTGEAPGSLVNLYETSSSRDDIGTDTTRWASCLGGVHRREEYVDGTEAPPSGGSKGWPELEGPRRAPGFGFRGPRLTLLSSPREHWPETPGLFRGMAILFFGGKQEPHCLRERGASAYHGCSNVRWVVRKTFPLIRLHTHRHK